MWKLTWGDDSKVVAAANPEEFVATVNEAVQAVSNTRVVLEVVAPSGAEMTVAFGQPSVATFKATQHPPYFVSHGAGNQDDSLTFYRQGHESEFGADAGISAADALAGLAEFLETSQRPTVISWRVRTRSRWRTNFQTS